MHAAIDELPAMRVISWVLTAQDLLEACEALTAGGASRTESGDPQRPSRCWRRRIWRPFRVKPGARTIPAAKAFGGRASGARLHQFTGEADALIDTVLRDMTDRLGGILDTYAADATELDDGREVLPHGG